LADLKYLTAEELMLRYQTYNPTDAFDAFNELYFRYSQRVYNFLNKKIRNNADCDDLLQKVFIKVHESKHLYKEKYKFEQWLFVIARTQTLDFFRSQQRYAARLKKYEPEIVEKSIVDLSALSHLNPDQQELLEMKYIDELSYQEIALIVNKTEGSLRKSLSRLVGRLKNE
jgi:RNA polymerase sigma factor (sigma-70 family)